MRLPVKGRYSSPNLSEISLDLVDIHEASWSVGFDILFSWSAWYAVEVSTAAGGSAYTVGSVTSARDAAACVALMSFNMCCDVLCLWSPQKHWHVVLSGPWTTTGVLALALDFAARAERRACQWILSGGG